MTRQSLVVVCLLVSSAVSLGSEVPSDEFITIENVTNDEGVKGIRATFRLEATREEIWGLFTDYKRFRETFKGIRDLQVLNENEKGALVRFKIRVLLFPFQYTLQRDYVRLNELLTWHRTDGAFRHISGRWEIFPGPREGIHEVIWESFVDVGFLVPESMVRNRTAKEFEKAVARMRLRLAAD